MQELMIDMFYPVGSVYISADKNKTKYDPCRAMIATRFTIHRR